VALLALSLFGLSGGTLYLRKFAPDIPPFTATGVQLTGGALPALLLAVFFETPDVQWSPSLIGAMAWNALFMSIAGMALYNLMMDHYGAAKAAAGFFIVPGRFGGDRMAHDRRAPATARADGPFRCHLRCRAGVVATKGRNAYVAGEVPDAARFAGISNLSPVATRGGETESERCDPLRRTEPTRMRRFNKTACLPGAELPHVQLRSLADCRAIIEGGAVARRTVVLGAGLMGVDNGSVARHWFGFALRARCRTAGRPIAIVDRLDSRESVKRLVEPNPGWRFFHQTSEP
jgi:hypothetical protein